MTAKCTMEPKYKAALNLHKYSVSKCRNGYCSKSMVTAPTKDAASLHEVSLFGGTCSIVSLDHHAAVLLLGYTTPQSRPFIFPNNSLQCGIANSRAFKPSVLLPACASMHPFESLKSYNQALSFNSDAWISVVVILSIATSANLKPQGCVSCSFRSSIEVRQNLLRSKGVYAG